MRAHNFLSSSSIMNFVEICTQLVVFSASAVLGSCSTSFASSTSAGNSNSTSNTTTVDDDLFRSNTFDFSLDFREKLEALLMHQQQQPPSRDTNKSSNILFSSVADVREQFAMPMPMRAVFQAMYALIFVVALAGNCAVIVVYRVARRWRRDISVFHLNLAVADILLAVFCVPFTAQQVLDHFWPLPPLMCPLVLFLQITSVSVSVYTLVVIGIDRLVFVKNPLAPHIFTGARGRLIMLGVWTLSMLMAGAQLLFYRVVTVYNGRDDDNKLHECTLAFDRLATAQLFGNFLVTYLIPLAVLVIIYAHVGRLVWAREPPGVRISHAGREQLVLAQKKQLIASLIIIVALFALAWLPLHLFVILNGLLPEATMRADEYHKPADESYHSGRAYYVNQVRRVYLPCHLIAMLSTCTNPLVYAFMHVSFRSDCRRALHKLRRWLILHCCPARTLGDDVSADSISVKTEENGSIVLNSINLSSTNPQVQAELLMLREHYDVGFCTSLGEPATTTAPDIKQQNPTI